MFAMALGLRGQTTPERSSPAKAARFAVLLGALVLMSAAVNALVILAGSNFWQRSAATSDCSVITREADRLACYDKLASRPVRHPFKGANAPAFSHSL